MKLKSLLKPVALILLGIASGALAGRYGPAAVSYAIIPPSHGMFRYYPSYDGRGLLYWQYWSVENSYLVSVDFRENRLRENWEIVRKDSSHFFLYDDRNEFDGEVTFTRTEMILRNLAGREEHYPRVLDLWEIWHAKYGRFAGADGPGDSLRLAPARAAHDTLIAARMKQQGLTVSPAASARQRPPRPPLPPVDNSAQSKPVFVVSVWGAWNSIGTVFALYADGTAMARTPGEIVGREDPEPSYHWIDPKEAVQLATELVPPDLSSLPGRYDLSNATDEDITTLWISGKRIEIYGPWREPRLLPEDPDDPFADSKRVNNEVIRRKWATLPASLRQILQRIDRLRQAPGREWLPAKIEVRFSNYEYARGKPIQWPRAWPGLYDATSQKNGPGDYSVFVPTAEWPKLRAFLATKPAGGAVMIDLNQMAPRVRFPFPNEAMWLKPPPPYPETD